MWLAPGACGHISTGLKSIIHLNLCMSIKITHWLGVSQLHCTFKESSQSPQNKDGHREVMTKHA